MQRGVIKGRVSLLLRSGNRLSLDPPRPPLFTYKLYARTNQPSENSMVRLHVILMMALTVAGVVMVASAEDVLLGLGLLLLTLGMGGLSAAYMSSLEPPP